MWHSIRTLGQDLRGTHVNVFETLSQSLSYPQGSVVSSGNIIISVDHPPPGSIAFRLTRKPYVH